MSVCLRVTAPVDFLYSSLRGTVLEIRLLHTPRHTHRHTHRHVRSSVRLCQDRLREVVCVRDWPNHFPRLLNFSRDLSTKPNEQQIAAAQHYMKHHQKKKRKLKDWIMINVSILLLMFGISAAAVPLYKIFCSATGYGGTTKKHSEEDNAKVRTMEPVTWRPVTVNFSSTVNPGLDWEFTPVQEAVSLVPGETCLAFFTAKNNSTHVITGISTYNVTPFEAGAYFNKIQCFCFDEQTLNPGEELDMPVFFYIDPEFALDADLVRLKCSNVSLHYTFFDTAEQGGRFSQLTRELSNEVTAYLTGGVTSPPDFTVPPGADIVKINEEVYKKVRRRGHDKEFVVPGTTVVCHVTGSLPDTDRIFWSTKGGTPFSFTAGTGSVISGWEEGCVGMSEGEISTIHMSSRKGYGKMGNRSWNIPGHTNIAFEIEILSVR